MLGSALGRLGKSAELGETRDQPAPIVDRCRRGKSEKLMDPVCGQLREIGGGQFDRPRVFGPLAMHLRKVGCGLDAQFQVPEARGEFQRPVAGRERLVQLAEHRVEVYQGGADPASPMVVVQPLREGLGLAQVLQSPADFTELEKHMPQLETDFEVRLQCGLGLRQPLEDDKRLLEPDPGIRERRPRGRLLPGLPEILHRLFPQLPLDGVMGESFYLLAKAIRVQPFQRPDDPCVKLAAALLQQSAVRDLVRECVLEGVLEIWKEPRLVNELGGLQAVERAA